MTDSQNGIWANVPQAITKATIEIANMVEKEAENPGNTARSVQVMPRIGGAALKQPTFNWKTADKTKNYKALK